MSYLKAESANSMLDIMSALYRRLKRQIRNFFYWGWALRNDSNWDWGTLDFIVLIKLRQFWAAFNSSESMHDPECPNYSPKMKSLKLALKLAERLQADNYHEQLKYPIEYEFVKIEEGEFKGNFKMERLNPATRRPVTKLYNQMAMDEWDRREKRQDKDRVIMYHIIAKYGHYWWD